MKVELVPPPVVEQEAVLTMTVKEAQELRAILGGIGGTGNLTMDLYTLLSDLPGQKLRAIWSPTAREIVESFKEES